MKTLYIIRHGKSSWEDDELEDRERPLIEKGIKKTRKMSNLIKEGKVDLIVTSPAVRAKETSRIVAKTFEYPKENIKIEDVLYEGNENDVLKFVKGISDDVNTLMIFGHNPTFTDLSNMLIDEHVSLKTSGVVCIEFDTGRWKEISAENSTLKFVL
jgi:phosphohistidine phosphatase